MLHSERTKVGDWKGVGINLSFWQVSTVPYFTLNPAAVPGRAAASTGLDLYEVAREVYQKFYGVYLKIMIQSKTTKICYHSENSGTNS
jgi:hypothetical protein